MNERSSRWHYAIIGIIAATFLYVHLFTFSSVPIWRTGDQSVWFENADRMLHGERLYRDIFEFNLPGMELLYFTCFRFIGVSVWLPSGLLVAVGTVVILQLLAMSRRLLPGMAAMAPPLCFLLAGLRNDLDATHHWYSTCLVIVGINLVAEASGRVQFILGGATFAMASLFTSTRGICVAIAACLFLLWRKRSGWVMDVGCVAGGFTGLMSAIVICLAYYSGIKTLWKDLIVFSMRYYSAGEANNIASVMHAQWKMVLSGEVKPVALCGLWSAMITMITITSIVVLNRELRAQREEARGNLLRRDLAVLYSMAGAGAFLAVLTAPTLVRLNCAAAFIMVIVVACIYQYYRRWFKFGVVLMLACGIVDSVASIRHSREEVSGPRGVVALQNVERWEQFAWMARHAHSGDFLFGDTDFNFFFDLRNPAMIPWVSNSSYTRPEQVADVLSTLRRQKVRFMVWEPELKNACLTRGKLQDLCDYLDAHYQDETFADGTRIFVINEQ